MKVTERYFPVAELIIMLYKVPVLLTIEFMD